MQPLLSPIDHESRHNSHRTEDIQEAGIAEDTPLLHRFPAATTPPRNPITTIVVTLLLIILLSGIIIGIYLLVLQSSSENVLPPVDMPLQLVRRAQWSGGGAGVPALALTPRRAKQVIVAHTGTRQCHSTRSCTELLLQMQNNTTAGEDPLSYNFLISSNGQTYEGLGWRKQSPLLPQEAASALVLAFIGNFTRDPPCREQILEAKNLFAESVRRQYLDPSYALSGRRTKISPYGLYSTMKQFPHWTTKLSDTLTV